MLVEPDDVGGELVGDVRPGVGRDQHVAARNLDLVLENQRDRLALAGAVEIAALGDDALDPRRLAGFGDDDFVARRNAAGGDGAGKAAEVEVGPVDVLHRKAERTCVDPRFVQRHRSPDARAASGPSTRAVWPKAAVTLSPKRADIGIGMIEAKPRSLANAMIVGDNLVENSLVE